MQTTKPLLAKAIETSSDGLLITLADRRVRIAWENCSPRLANASAQERQNAELSPGGYGVHWPLIDEDLSITWLLEQAGPTSKKRFNPPPSKASKSPSAG